MPTELRVHGVSGTPPSEMLYTGPVTYDQTSGLAKVYETNRDTWTVKAFHWGSLTSRNALTALWILVAPFAMGNVAGWMSEKPNVWSRTWIRVGALALTGIFFAQAANVAMDLPLAKDYEPAHVILIYIGFSIALVGGLVVLTTRSSRVRLGLLSRFRFVFWPTLTAMSHLEDDDWSDPTGGARLVTAEMWTQQSLPHRLRRIHIAFGTSLLAIVAARNANLDTVESLSVAVAGVSLVVLGLSAGRLARFQPVVWVTAWLPLASVAAFVWAVLGLDNLGSGVVSNVADDLTFQLALILLVAGVLALIGELVATKGAGGLVPLGLLTVGALIGASYGLTAAMLAETYLPGSGPESSTLGGGAAFVTVAMLGLVVVMAITFALTMVLGRGDEDQSALRLGVLRSRITIGVAGVYGFLVGGVAAALSCEGGKGCSQTRLDLPDWVKEDVGAQVELLGLPFDPGSLLGWAKILLIAVPAFLILRSITGGLLNGQDARRKVGIVWDLGSFWPRWFHPLAPPAYAPNAVESLRKTITDETPSVLSAHSQGSLISAVTICRLRNEEVPPKFISYGSQIGDLYPKLFPGVGFDELTATVAAKLHDEWLNLWRPSDPIGGQVINELGDRNWIVRTGSGHGRYELTAEFCAARKPGLGRPADADLTDCWDSP